MVSDILQRFIFTSIDSVPHLEAILLLRYDPRKEWDPKEVAQTLYINEKKAEEILADLHSSKILNKHDHLYSYGPLSVDLQEKIDQLADAYGKNLIEVTNLIHSKTNKQARQFGDAFKWQNED